MSIDAMKQALEALEDVPYMSNKDDYERFEKAQHALRLAIEQAERQQDDLAYREAVSLAKAIFKKHFAHEEHYASGRIVWQPLDTTAGVISQIDNMTCRLVAPPQRQPLTEEEIVACIDDVFAWALDDGNIDDSHVIRFTRAIERAHGIGGGE
jgi:hypothetical protein